MTAKSRTSRRSGRGQSTQTATNDKAGAPEVSSDRLFGAGGTAVRAMLADATKLTPEQAAVIGAAQRRAVVSPQRLIAATAPIWRISC